MKKPNILFMFSDQQRWDTVGCYGKPGGFRQPWDVTPNLDRLAAEGVRFENAFTCQPVCGPARACLQTGKYATEMGCFRNGIPLPLDQKTMAHHLSDVGYEVGYIGKWHLASWRKHWGEGGLAVDYETKPIPPSRRGGYKDYWIAADTLEWTSHSYDGYMFNADMEKITFPEGRYRVDAQTDWVLDYLRSRDGERPFFLFVSYLEPHHQNDHHRYEGPEGSQERFKGFQAPGDLEGMDGDWPEQLPDYLGCVTSLDENLGRMRNELGRLGLADDTLIVYTSDHGSHFRTRNGEYKRSCHEASVRIPMIVQGPGFVAGRVCAELVSLLDLTPTVLTAGSAEVPASMRGRPLQDLVEGRAEGWREEVFIQISESQVGRALRTGRWKYSVRAPGGDGVNEMSSDRYVEEFLYDLESDPHERSNLVADPGLEGVRAELREQLTRRMVEAGEEAPTIGSQDG